MRRAFAVLFLALTMAGCGEKKTETAPDAETAAAAASAVAGTKTVDAAQAGSVTGKATFQGAVAVPKKISVQGNPECAALHEGGSIASEELVVGDGGGLANVFVYVKEGLEGYRFDVPAEPVRIGNTNCIYVPHVAGAMTGQSIEYVNDDATLHNIHSYAKANKGFNLGLPFKGMKQTRKFDAAEIMVQLKCDVHPWMIGYVGVVPHPYHAVSGKDGAYELKGLPAGTYTIEAWHEKLGTKTATVTVAAQGTQNANFSFAAA